MSELTVLEKQLQQYTPEIYSLYVMMKPSMSGDFERKLPMLVDALVKYYDSNATGQIVIEYSKGRIAHIDTKVRLTANTTERTHY